MIPVIEIAPLFDADSSAWTGADAELSAAARDIGFVSLRGLPRDLAPHAGRRAELLRVFALEESAKRCLFRRKFAPENRNVYRGWFPLQPGHLTFKEGLDLGGDVAYGPALTRPGDPLRDFEEVRAGKVRVPGRCQHWRDGQRYLERLRERDLAG